MQKETSLKREILICEAEELLRTKREFPVLCYVHICTQAGINLQKAQRLAKPTDVLLWP